VAGSCQPTASGSYRDLRQLLATQRERGWNYVAVRPMPATPTLDRRTASSRPGRPCWRAIPSRWPSLPRLPKSVKPQTSRRRIVARCTVHGKDSITSDKRPVTQSQSWPLLFHHRSQDWELGRRPRPRVIWLGHFPRKLSSTAARSSGNCDVNSTGCPEQGKVKAMRAACRNWRRSARRCLRKPYTRSPTRGWPMEAK
jgi:hypothetical protein